MNDFDASKLTIRSVMVFLSVFDTKSVTEASIKFGLSQSTVSHTLNTLRKHFNDQLFVTEGRSLTPTDRSRTIEPFLRRIESEFYGVFEERPLDAMLYASPIKIATNTTSQIEVLQRFTEVARKEYPDIILDFLDLGPFSNVQKFLYSNSVDIIAVAHAQKYAPGLMSTKFNSDPNRMYYDPSKRGPVENLEQFQQAKHGTIDFGGNRKSLFQEWLDEKNIGRNVVISAPNAFCLANLIRGTDTVVTLGESLASTAFAGLEHCAPPFSTTPNQFDLVWHSRSDSSARLKWIVKRLSEAAIKPIVKRRADYVTT